MTFDQFRQSHKVVTTWAEIANHPEIADSFEPKMFPALTLHVYGDDLYWIEKWDETQIPKSRRSYFKGRFFVELGGDDFLGTLEECEKELYDWLIDQKAFD